MHVRVRVPVCSCSFREARAPVVPVATGDQGMAHGLLPAARRAPAHTNHLHRGADEKQKKRKTEKKRGKTRKMPTTAAGAAQRIGIHNEARLMIILKIHKAARLWN